MTHQEDAINQPTAHRKRDTGEAADQRLTRAKQEYATPEAQSLADGWGYPWRLFKSLQDKRAFDALSLEDKLEALRIASQQSKENTDE